MSVSNRFVNLTAAPPVLLVQKSALRGRGCQLAASRLAACRLRTHGAIRAAHEVVALSHLCDVPSTSETMRRSGPDEAAEAVKNGRDPTPNPSADPGCCRLRVPDSVVRTSPAGRR